MEITKQLIEKAVSIKECNNILELDNAFDSVYALDINELLLCDDDNKLIRNCSGVLHKLHSEISQSLAIKNESAINKLSSIIKSIAPFFIKAIDENDIKAFLVFLFANNYFNISTKFWGNSIENKEDKYNKLSRKIADLFLHFQFNLGLKEDAPYNENESLKKYEEGIKDENVEKVYSFIQSIERGGRGFYFYFLVKSMLRFLLEINIKKGAEIINTAKTPAESVFYLTSLKSNLLLKIINTGSLSNRWGLFEILRQLFLREKDHDNLNPDEKLAVYKALVELYKNHKNIYCQVLKFRGFQQSKLFNAALGCQILDFNKEEIYTVCEILPIDKYSNNIEARKWLLSEIISIKGKESFLELVTKLFEKWENLCNNQKNEYQNTILLSDFAYFIVEYYYLLNNDVFSSELRNVIVNIVYIDSEWFIDGSSYISSFHIYLSKLYLMSYAYKMKEISNPDIESLVKQLTNNQIIKSYYYSQDKLDAFEIIENNICSYKALNA